MKKPDDELKIDISELFGGELSNTPDPSEEIVETVDGAGSEVTTAHIEAAANDNQYQEWLVDRQKDMELKSLELEKKLQEEQAHLNEKKPNQETSSTENISENITTVSEAKNNNQESPIDFNAPIAPPFMGGVVNSLLDQSGMTKESSSAEEAEPPEGQKYEELKKLQSDHEFLMLYEEYRAILFRELNDLVGEKKTKTMLERTFELSRSKYPEIFRNANWDSKGNLLDDGSLDSQRMVENKNALDPAKSDMAIDAALSHLLGLRLQAIEKGLGAGFKNKVRARLYFWINEKNEKAIKEGKEAFVLKRLMGFIP